MHHRAPQGPFFQQISRIITLAPVLTISRQRPGGSDRPEIDNDDALCDKEGAATFSRRLAGGFGITILRVCDLYNTIQCVML